MVQSKKKLNSIKRRLSGINSVSQIIRKSETSEEDLQKLAERLNLKIRIAWREDYDPKYEFGQILNMGSPETSGTHWVATFRDKYFDSLSMAPPPNLMHLQWTPLDIQNQDYGGCGIYCVMWLYYVMNGKEAEFYSQFHPLNIDSY